MALSTVRSVAVPRSQRRLGTVFGERRRLGMRPLLFRCARVRERGAVHGGAAGADGWGHGFCEMHILTTREEHLQRHLVCFLIGSSPNTCEHSG